MKTRDAVRIVVVGGGVSGLRAAQRIRELALEGGRDPSLLLLEASPRLGGQILTERTGDLLLEAGPDGFVTHKPAGRLLCERLGLGPELVEIDARPVHVLHRGRPVPLGAGFSMLAPSGLGPLLRTPLFSWRGKLRVAAERFVAPRPATLGDESVGTFVARRFGREMLERVAEPVLAGIFTADVRALSLRMALPRLAELEQRHGSVMRGLRQAHGSASGPTAPGSSFLALQGGLGRLTDRLARELPAGVVRTGAAAERVDFDPATARYRIAVADGTRHEAEVLVLACPSHVAAGLLGRVDGALSDELGRLEHASCATVSLCYERSAIGTELRGHGFFVPRAAGLPILACSYVHLKFPERAPRDRALLRVFLGEAHQAGLVDGRDDATLAELAHRALAPLLSIRSEPLLARTYRFPRSMPQYAVGHRSWLERVETLAAARPGLFLCGAALGSLGLPDCIASAERAAASAIEFIRAAPSQAPVLGRVSGAVS